MCVILGAKFVSPEIVETLNELRGYFSGDDLSRPKNDDKGNEGLNNTAVLLDSQTRLFNNTIVSQSLFYREFKGIYDVVPESEKFSLQSINYYFNPDFLLLFLKKYLTYTPFWTGILYGITTITSNSHVENYFATIKRRCRRSWLVGKMPTNSFDFLKRVENEKRKFPSV